jgi:PAS domain-containing protein
MKKKSKKNSRRVKAVEIPEQTEPEHLQDLQEESWSFLKNIVDTAREPFLVLDKNLRVMMANESFYKTFHVDHAGTENKLVYRLGNGQWNIPALRKLLEDILPRNTFFRGFEMSHDFPVVGHKVMLLNARQIYREDGTPGYFPSIILLAMEDITDMMSIAEKFVDRTNDFESKIMEQTNRLERNLNEIKKEMGLLSETRSKKSM